MPCFPTETQNTTSEESHTILPSETLPELPTENEPPPVEPSVIPEPTTQTPDLTLEPLDFEIEYDSGHQGRDEQVGEEDEDDGVPLS